jgi:hypothetical protein
MPDPSWDEFVASLDPDALERERAHADPPPPVPRDERPGSARDRRIRAEHDREVHDYYLVREWRRQYDEREAARAAEDPYQDLTEPPI